MGTILHETNRRLKMTWADAYALTEYGEKTVEGRVELRLRYFF
jgi:hypothetical protein